MTASLFASLSPLASQPFAVVDLETTGASAIYDRIIEVGVVRLVGGEIVDRYEQLIDPRVPIPPFITRLTGIDARMVRGRPDFGAVVSVVQAAIAGGPLVAHNASFDEAFLRHAFTRAGLRLDRPRLCTLRLARRLLPRLPSYRLDALTTYFGLKVPTRHRALADAEATAGVLLRLLDLAGERGVDTLDGLFELQGQPIGRKRRGVDESIVASLTSGPGVYLLKDADGHVVYVGKSVHVRQRVREHLRGGSLDQPRLRRRLASIVDVEAFATGSELEALFLESRLIKRYLPDANLLQRNDKDYPFIRIDMTAPHPRLEATREPPSGEAIHFGPFRRRATAAVVVDLLTETLGLRQCTEPLKPGQSACALLDLGKCLGPCVGAVDDATYRAAAQRAANVLQGTDETLLTEWIARRDALAEEWRFEEAASLRDQIRALEHIVGMQRRLDSVANRNLAIVAPSIRPTSRELFFIRRGQVVGQMTVSAQARTASIERALGRAFAGEVETTVTREKVDEMHLLDGWLKRHTERLAVVHVDLSNPADAAPAVAAALRTPLATQTSARAVRAS
ncbi:MAG: GIY-YIG nuclease family protein [Chloroflexi bacterium]|nr:GIY-YIG nuclease family protein [Chloroflexota bacterium]